MPRRPRRAVTVAQLVLVARLAQLRQTAGLTQAEAAATLGRHPAALARLETAQTEPAADDVRKLLDQYGVTRTERRRVLEMLEEAVTPGWWEWEGWRGVLPPGARQWIGVEAAASEVRVWSPGLVPDLLQTPDYTRALWKLRGADDQRARLAADFTRRRQERLAQHGAVVRAVLDAPALTTPVGDARLLEAQRARLRSLNRTRWSVRVLPAHAPPHPLLGTAAASVLRVPPQEIPDHLVTARPDVWALETDDTPVSAWRQAWDATALAATPLHKTGKEPS